MTEQEIDNEWIEETFEERVEAEASVTLEDVEEWYQEKMAEYGDEKLARITVQAEFNSWVNAGADGEVEMITIGGRDDPFNDGEVFIGFAVCIPEDRPVKLGAVVFRKETCDPGPYKDYFFEPFNPVHGEFEISNPSAPIGDSAYRMDAVRSTEVSRFEAEKDRGERREMVLDYVDDAEIANIGEHLSLTNEDGWAATFGVDMRRIPQAYVHEARVGKAARLVVQDNSFVDARDLGHEVRGDDGDAGLVGFADSRLVNFDVGSIVDLYGALTPNQDGRVTMDIVGVDPIKKVERENTGGSSESSSEEESVSRGSGGAGADEERTI